MRAALALAFALVLAPACVGSRWMRGHAFVPPLRHYRVRYADPSHHDVLGAGWRVLNHDGAGVRQSSPWWSDEWVELGGSTSQQRVAMPSFDLYAEHDDDGAVLSLRTVPLSSRRARRPLEALAHALVTYGLGENVRLVEDPVHPVEVVSSEVVDEAPASVGGADAYWLTARVAVTGARTGRTELVSCVLVRPGAWRWRASGVADHEGVPMLVIATYRARADRHARHLADFTSMLSRLDVRPAP